MHDMSRQNSSVYILKTVKEKHLEAKMFSTYMTGMLNIPTITICFTDWKHATSSCLSNVIPPITISCIAYFIRLVALDLTIPEDVSTFMTEHTPSQVSLSMTFLKVVHTSFMTTKWNHRCYTSSVVYPNITECFSLYHKTLSVEAGPPQVDQT